MTGVRCLLALVGIALVAALACTPAAALPPPVGVQAGRAARVASPAPVARIAASCKLPLPVIGEVAGGVCAAASAPAEAVAGLAGQAAGVVGGSILDVLATWMIGAATQITTFVARAMTQTSTPQLESAWFEAQFAPMADLGAALGLLVALIALGSAAIRRSPQALAATLAGIARAGIGTGLVVALTTIGLQVADQISAAVVSGSPHAFWSTVAHAWGASGFGGFGSSALAMLIALVEVFAAVFVWLELIVRDAAIYVAVLLFPVGLAAAIWPALSAWPARLGRLLLLFVILKPLTLIVLSLAGSAAAAGLSFDSGVQGSVGTILSAVVIYALAAFAPWALMHLLAADAESAHTASGLRTAAGAAVLDRGGRSLRSGGGLMALDGGSGTAGGPRGGGPRRGRGGPRGHGGGGGRSSGGGPGASGGGGATSADAGALALGAGGSVAAAAGMGAGRAAARARGAEDSKRSSTTTGPRPQHDEDAGARADRQGSGGKVIALPARDGAEQAPARQPPDSGRPGPTLPPTSLFPSAPDGPEDESRS